MLPADAIFNSVVMIFTVKESILNRLDQEPGTEARFSQRCLRGSPAVSAGVCDGGDPTDTVCPQQLLGKNREPLWIPTMGMEGSSLLPLCLLFPLTLFLFLSLPPTPFPSLELFKLSCLPFPFIFCLLCPPPPPPSRTGHTIWLLWGWCLLPCDEAGPSHQRFSWLLSSQVKISLIL